MKSLRRIEQEVLALGLEWTRLELQKRLQEHCDALPAACAQTGQPLENTRWRQMQLDTVATPPETSPVEFGRRLHREALRRGLARAQVIYLVMDGAVWLWDLAEDRFKDALKTLDFHHAREHLHAVAESIHDPGTPQSKEWLSGMLHRLRHGKETQVVQALEQLLESHGQRSVESQEIITREVKYFQGHKDHLHYSAMEKAGAPLGSGAVESLGKQLQRRLRGCGQFWGRPGLPHLLHLSALVKNHDHHHLWN